MDFETSSPSQTPQFPINFPGGSNIKSPNRQMVVYINRRKNPYTTTPKTNIPPEGLEDDFTFHMSLGRSAATTLIVIVAEARRFSVFICT